MKTAEDIRFIIQKNLEIAKNPSKKALDSLFLHFEKKVTPLMVKVVDDAINEVIGDFKRPEDFKVVVHIDPSTLPGHKFTDKHRNAYLEAGLHKDATFEHLTRVRPGLEDYYEQEMLDRHLSLASTELLFPLLDLVVESGYKITGYIANDASSLDNFNFTLTLTLDLEGE